MNPDSLQIDSAQIALWQSDGRYDYDREIVGGSQNLLEWISEIVSERLGKVFNTALDNDVVYYSLMGLGFLLALFLAWLLWRSRFRLFMKTEKKDDALDYEVTEDSIYGVDFDAELSEAYCHQNYRQVVRLLYLQTLLWLQESGMIDWQPSKTPAQYMRHVNKTAFSTMTSLFVMVRYGNYEADAPLCQQMRQLQETLMLEGGEPHE